MFKLLFWFSRQKKKFTFWFFGHNIGSKTDHILVKLKTNGAGKSERMEKVMNLIKPKPDPKQLLRDWQRKLRQECRNIERQIRGSSLPLVDKFRVFRFTENSINLFEIRLMGLFDRTLIEEKSI